MNEIEQRLKKEIKEKQIPEDKWIEERNKIPISKRDINKMILNHFILEGNKDAVECFEKEVNESIPYDRELLSIRDSIRKSIILWDIDSAIDKINDLNNEILENNQNLLFQLKRQKFIKLLLDGKIEEAIVFSQEELFHIAMKDNTLYKEFEDLMVLFVYNNIRTSKYKDYLSEKYINTLISLVNKEIIKSQMQIITPSIQLMFKIMIWNQSELKENGFTFPEIDLSKLFDFKTKMDLD